MKQHFVVNESLFVIDMDDKSESILPLGEVLSDGIKLGVDRDRGEDFCFYISEDGAFDVLAVKPHLAERWVADGYLKKHMLQRHFNQNDELDCYLLISPTSLILSRLTEVRAHGSRHTAHMIATTMWSSRLKDQKINLRDGILCELYGVVLPTYTRTPHVADAALFANTLRAQYDDEDLRAPSDFKDGSGGLNQMTFNEALTRFNIEKDKKAPYFMLGELVDDFVQVKSGASITGPLIIRDEFQVFATDSDVLLLAMSNAWAESLVENNALMQMDIKNVQLGREVVKVLALPRNQALEVLDDRHFGVALKEVFEMTLAIKRTRQKLPEASLKNALYVKELGLVLPVKFEGGSRGEDVGLVRSIVTEGPFAQSPFLDDVLTSCVAVINHG